MRGFLLAGRGITPCIPSRAKRRWKSGKHVLDLVAHLKLALAKSLPHNCPPMRLLAGPPPLRTHSSMNMLQNITSTLTDMIARGWENFLARPQGTLNFRIHSPTYHRGHIGASRWHQRC